jgi:hypothetical protein
VESHFAGCTWLCPGHAQTLCMQVQHRSLQTVAPTLRARRLVRGLACDVSSFGWVLQTLQAVPGCVQVMHKPCACRNNIEVCRVAPARYELTDLLETPCMRCRFIWWSPTDFAGCTWLCQVMHKPCACRNNTEVCKRSHLHTQSLAQTELREAVHDCTLREAVHDCSVHLGSCMDVSTRCTNPVYASSECCTNPMLASITHMPVDSRTCTHWSPGAW